MQDIQTLASTCRVANAHEAVLNSECCYTFHSPYTTKHGIVVNLHTFVGTVQEMALTGSTSTTNNHKQIFVRIVKERIEKEGQLGQETTTTTAPPTKLGIGVEGGFVQEHDKYETRSTYSVLVLEPSSSAPGEVTVVCEEPYNERTKENFPTMVAMSVDSIINHVGMTTQQDVKVWQMDQDEVPVSKYAVGLPFVDNGISISPNPKDWKCEKSGDVENLWLNLSDGYIGGGRQHWDGSGGSNGALDHFQETGQQYPLVVKLGTITSDLETADCYSYAPDEDGPVKVPNLADLLERRGIKVAHMQKTVKSTAELEVELNANYAFDAITEAGCDLKPVSGPGLQGLQNLGNSCYMNSVLQLLFSGIVPELSTRYGTLPNGSIINHPFLASVSPVNAPYDLLCQVTKVGNALTSGVFTYPITDDCKDDARSTDPKYRLAPRMFKHIIGKDHVDFCTGQQQDAAQFLQYLLERLDRAEMGGAAQYPTLLKKGDTTRVTSQLFAFQTTDRLVCSADQKIKYKQSAAETIWSVRIPMEKAVLIEGESEKEDDTVITSPEQKRQKSSGKDEKKHIPTIKFETCVEEWGEETSLDDIRWPHLRDAKHPASQVTRFSNFPRYLIVQMQRYKLGPDWQPIKLEVNLDIPQELDLNNYRTNGPQEGEELVPTEEEPESGNATAQQQTLIDEIALSQLVDMGFTLNSCKRALHAVGGSDVEAAMNWVFEHNEDPDFNDPLPEGSDTAAAPVSSQGDVVDEVVVQSLVENLGCFTGSQVRAALKECNGDADRAADWLFSHMDNLDNAIASLQSKDMEVTITANVAVPSCSVPLDDGIGMYTMIGMISHIGKNTSSGHYVAHLKKDDKWVIFNDEKVALSSQPPFAHAYMYLFQRKDTIGLLHKDN